MRSLSFIIMEPLIIPEPRHVKIIKACALYIFPALIVLLLTALFFIPTRKTPRTIEEIDATIQKLEIQKTRLK